jgi:hypothetical protein
MLGPGSSTLTLPIFLLSKGKCLDHIYTKQSTVPSAGIGAFARRMIPELLLKKPALCIVYFAPSEDQYYYYYSKYATTNRNKPLEHSFEFGRHLHLTLVNNHVILTHYERSRKEIKHNERKIVSILSSRHHENYHASCKSKSSTILTLTPY